MAENIYASPVHFDAELKRIFRRHWVCAGLGEQVANPGDIHPVTVGDLPLMLVRGEDGEVGVFHNVCRHRGAKLVTEPCEGRKMIRCPYHSWVYGLDGRTVQRPHFSGPDQHSQVGDGLWRVPSAMWADLVFVDIDGAAGPFDEFIAPLHRIGAAYGVEEARRDRTIELEIQANWKLVVENFVDGYHVASVHPALEKSVPTRTHTFRTEGRLCIGEAPRNVGGSGASYVAGLPEFPGVTEAARGRLTYMSVFPNLCIGMTADRLTIFLMQPLAPDRTWESIHNYYAPAAFVPETDDIRRAMTENLIDFNNEDMDALARLQAGRSSDIYDAGQPSPYWDTCAEVFLKQCAEGVAG